MAKQEDLLKKAFKDLTRESAPMKEAKLIRGSKPIQESKLIQESTPTKQQKDEILNRILIESRQSNSTLFTRLTHFITVYPWRFAIAGSILQAVILTLIFGTKYTNLLLNYFGG